MEVVYTGLRATPEALVQTAIQETCDVIGLSVLSGAHLTLSGRLLERLRAADAGDVAVVVGGTIPARDAAALRAMGVHAVFPMGTPLPEIVSYFRAYRRAEA
jgi:methylmalonyl-CoA mutase C-terminal domain/subunit